MVRVEYKIQTIIACMLIKVDHTFDFELLNKSKERYSKWQIYCWAHKIKAKRNIVIHIAKTRRNYCLDSQKREPCVTIATKVLSHSTTSRVSLLSEVRFPGEAE